MRFNSLFAFSFFLQLLFFSAGALSPCSHSRDCYNRGPETLDFCATFYSTCISVSSPRHERIPNTVHHSALPTFQLSTLRNIINETNSSPLSLQEKLRVIEGARDILENVNVNHLLYLNLYKYNASEELHNLRKRLIAGHRMRKRATNLSFHLSMQKVFAGLNDRHTTYVPPPPLSVSVAFLGFYARQFFSRGDTHHRRYAVADVPKDFRFLFKLEEVPFREGTEILTYDGIPVDDAVIELGRQGLGSNSAARIDSGLFVLSFRLLVVDSLPSKRTVKIGYRRKNGNTEFVDLPWLLMKVPNGTVDTVFGPSSPLNLMRKQTTRANVKQHDFHQYTDKRPYGPRKLFRGVSNTRKKKIRVIKPFQSLFDAEILETKVGPIGRLTLPSFDSEVTEELIFELTRVLKLMPKGGLILDARRNTGGQGDYARAISELVSDREIEELPETARATKLMEDIYLSDGFLERNRRFIGDNDRHLRNSLVSALKVGESSTGPFGNIFPRRTRPQRVYRGPVVSIIDGLTYSAGDVFASLQKDQNVSLLVGTSDSTGAGGASTNAYSILSFLSPRALKPLPEGIDIVTAIRRYYRSGLQRGAIVESFGIKPDIRYYPSYNDVVLDDHDFFDFLGEMLASRAS